MLLSIYLAVLLQFWNALGSHISPNVAPTTAPFTASQNLHGLCYDEFGELTQATPLVVEDGSLLEVTDLGLSDKQVNETLTDKDKTLFLFCIWFESSINANFIIDSQYVLADELEIHSSSLQSANDGIASNIICDETAFQVATTKQIESYHLCSKDCESASCTELFVENESESSSNDSKNDNTMSGWMWTLGLAVFGLCALVFIVAVTVYVITLCRNRSHSYQARNQNKQTKTEEVIEEVLDEIAKYTIGDADDDFLYKEDWLYDPSSDSNDGQILGDKILHAVKSSATLPNMPKKNSSKDVIKLSNDKDTKNNTNNNNNSNNKNKNMNITVASGSNSSSNLAAVIVTNTNSHNNTSNDEHDHSIDETSSDTELELRAATLVKRRISLDDFQNINKKQKSSSCEELGQSIANINENGTMSVEEKEIEQK